MPYSKVIGLFCLALAACGAPSEPTDSYAEPLAGTTASGVVPTGLPARLMVGLFEDSGNTWLKTSGVRWDARYRYFTKGWVNNWGYSSYDGSWGLGYLRETDQQGYLPAIQYYQLVAEAGGGEAQTLQKVQSASTMSSYFGDFKILMQRVKDFGKPTLVLLEADGVGFLEQQSGGNANTYAAIAASGVPELAGLPNTVAGFGLAFLQLRKSVGANNAILGMHVSAWASGKDIASYNVTDPLQPEVDKVAGFLGPLGLAANVTGSQYDVLVGDPLDRDADYYRVVQGQDKTWDTSDGASVNSRSFNRYAEWLHLWNTKTSKRWVLWQIPLGNSNHKNVWNNGGSAEGYKDNRPEYFFGTGNTAHLEKFAGSGVLALLFGAGASGQSSYQNDTYSDGQLFMKSRAGALLNAGGLAIASGGGASGTGGANGAGGAGSGAGGSGGTGGSTSAPADTAKYNFESTTQGWSATGNVSAVASSTDRAAAGTRSLKLSLGSSGSGSARVSNPSVPAGATVTFHVWLPTGNTVSAVQPYVLQGANGGWAWTGNWQPSSALLAGNWNTLSVRVPSNAAALYELGVQFSLNSGGGVAYVDAVNW